MSHKLKTLGIAVFAVLALSAFVSTAAQAAKFTASKYPTSFTAESAKGNDTFKTEAGTVECKSHFTGTLTEASETINVTPVYSECQAFGFVSAEVTMLGCTYSMNANGSPVVIVGTCEKIIIHSSTCTTKIPKQGNLSKMDFTNGTGDIKAQATITGIAYEVTQDGFLCPYNGTGAKTGATYTQDSAITIQSTNGATIDVG